MLSIDSCQYKIDRTISKQTFFSSSKANLEALAYGWWSNKEKNGDNGIITLIFGQMVLD